MAEYPLFIEDATGGVWRLADSDISRDILPRASASDLGFLRLKVNDLETAASVLARNGFSVGKLTCAIEVSRDRPIDLRDIAALMAENDIDVEITAMIPCNYQG